MSATELDTNMAPSSSSGSAALSDFLSRVAKSAGLALVVALLVFVFVNWADGFTSKFNLFNLTRNLSVAAVVGFGMMVVLVLGHMNLALGSIALASVMIMGWVMKVAGLPVPVAVACGLAIGTFLGLINGWLIVKTKLHSFIITLATASMFLGAVLIVFRAGPISDLPREFTGISKTRYFGWVSGMLVITAVAGVVLGIMYKYTTLGRQMLASGANADAAELSGIPVNRAILIAHGLSGFLAALAGVMFTARQGSALLSTGEDWLLASFLAPLLGGTLLAGGYVSVLGAFLGAMLVGILQNGLVLIGVPDFWVEFVLGLTLLATVSLDRLREVISARRGN